MASTDPAAARQRLFFALWPTPEVRHEVARLARKVLGNRGAGVASANLHVTLAFLGSMTGAQRAAVEAAAGQVTAEPFSLCLDRLGHWPRPRILWLGPRQAPASAQNLVMSLRTALQAQQLTPDLRPWQPHVTLARKINNPPQVTEVPAIHWPAQAFCLVESVTDPRGVRYQVLREWPLRS